jgi:putative ABC transport system substrate-binding protein
LSDEEGLYSSGDWDKAHMAFWLKQRTRLGAGGIALALCFLIAPIAATAQGQQIPRVGFLCWVTCGDAYHEAFWQALRTLGYADYKNITFENRAAGGDGASLDTLAAELVNLKPAVIVADTTQSARALKNATSTIPLVVVADDPVGSGLISNLARPEGNITGLSSVASELGVKQLQLLKEAVPGASKVAVLGNPVNPATELRLRAMQAAERELGVTLLMLEVRTPSEHENAFAALAQMGADAIIDILGAADRSNSATTGRVVQLALKHRLPAIYQSEDLVVEGGLMSYGPRLADEFRRAATYVNKILKGVKPADLPVEQPTRFYLAINLKAAAAIGIALPTSTLLRADEVIE